MNLRYLCDQTTALAVHTGRFIRRELHEVADSKIERKGKHDFVTYVDKEAERMLVSGLKQIMPEAGFLVEENTEEATKKEFTWVVDPLDGTTNYIHGIVPFAISIALLRSDRPVIGVVYEAGLDECFHATEGGKAFLNDREIHVSKARHLKDSLIATGFPVSDHSRIKFHMKILEHCIRNSHGVRRLGAAAADLAYVACGRFEGFYEYALNPWDVAAGSLIVREAGGIICDFSGGDNYLFGKEIVATNTGIFEEFMEIIRAAETDFQTA